MKCDPRDGRGVTRLSGFVTRRDFSDRRDEVVERIAEQPIRMPLPRVSTREDRPDDDAHDANNEREHGFHM